jgi:hypothetical protein
MAALGLVMFLPPVVQAQPNFSKNFTAAITVTKLDPTQFDPATVETELITAARGLAQHYVWYEGYTQHLSRVDVINRDNLVEEQVFQFWPDNPLTSCNGTAVTIPLPGEEGIAYTYDVRKNRCWNEALPSDGAVAVPVPHSNTSGFWDFVAQSTNAGTCTSIVPINKSGTLWQTTRTVNGVETAIGVCVASDNATPYWVRGLGVPPFCPNPTLEDPLPTCERVTIVFHSFSTSTPLNMFCPAPEVATACGLP